MRFVAVLVSHEDRYELGSDTLTRQPYLGIPVSNRMAGYVEFYRLTEEEFARFRADRDTAKRFSAECRGRRHDGRLVLPPGPDRGV